MHYKIAIYENLSQPSSRLSALALSQLSANCLQTIYNFRLLINLISFICK